jgi:hypothetical protein
MAKYQNILWRYDRLHKIAIYRPNTLHLVQPKQLI